MKPNKNDFLEDLDSDRDWIHTEVLGQNKKKSSILSIVTFVLVLICFGLLAYIAFKGGLSGQDLSNLNLDKVKQQQQNMSDEEKAKEEARQKLADEEAAKKAAETLIYTVKSGDTLAGIGDEFGVDYKIIAEANGLEEPYSLDVGQELKIPGVKKPATETPATPTDGTTYTVKAGDTLADIGLSLGIDYTEIAKLNNIEPPYTLEVGQVLKIPAKQ